MNIRLKTEHTCCALHARQKPDGFQSGATYGGGTPHMQHRVQGQKHPEQSLLDAGNSRRITPSAAAAIAKAALEDSVP